MYFRAYLSMLSGQARIHMADQSQTARRMKRLALNDLCALRLPSFEFLKVVVISSATLTIICYLVCPITLVMFELQKLITACKS